MRAEIAWAWMFGGEIGGARLAVLGNEIADGLRDLYSFVGVGLTQLGKKSKR